MLKRSIVCVVAALNLVACIHVEASRPNGPSPGASAAHAAHRSGASPAGMASMGGDKPRAMASGEAMVCPMGRLAPAGGRETMAARLALSPDQDAAFSEFMTALEGFRLMRHESMAASPPVTTSLPERLLAHEMMMEAHLLRLRAFRRSGEAFYERLTPDQRSKAEALLCQGR